MYIDNYISYNSENYNFEQTLHHNPLANVFTSKRIDTILGHVFDTCIRFNPMNEL
jgi:hypothetical protein